MGRHGIEFGMTGAQDWRGVPRCFRFRKSLHSSSTTIMFFAWEYELLAGWIREVQ